MSAQSLEIQCPACGQESFLRREPVYEGFKKVGEDLFCAGCGHRFDSEDEVQRVSASEVAVFTDADRPAAPQVFDTDSDMRNCRHYQHYLKNPFTEWCSRHRRETAATETCDQFERRMEGEGDDASAV